MKEEIWKPVKGFETFYEVSNLGRVQSLDRIVRHKPNRQAHNGCFQLRKGRVLKPSNVGKPSKDGKYYKRVTLVRHDGGKTYWRLHRLIAETFIPNPENKPEVNHINGIKDDNRVENLEWVTSQENSQHAIENGLQLLGGSNHPMSKLTENLVLEIRKLYDEDGVGTVELSRRFNVCRSTIGNIVNRKSWNHVE